MKIEELQKREPVDGVVCVSDSCIECSGDKFDVPGEKCTECELGLPPSEVTAENITEINRLRKVHKQTPLAPLAE